MRFEPVLIVQLVGAGLALAAAFGLPLTEEQRQAVLAFAAVVVAIMAGQGVIARAFVWSEAGMERERRQAAEERSSLA
jgi:hypothetical protein